MWPRLRSHRLAPPLLIGALLTMLAGGMHEAGVLARLDRFGLDLHFRLINNLPVDERIVLVDIDDSALAEMPEWPWPRRRFAQIVSTLDELGANVIALDLLFADASTPRLADLDRSEEAEQDGPSSEPLVPTGSTLIDDDQELRDALRAAGNVYIGAIASLERGPWNPNRSIDAALALLDRDPSVSDAALLRSLPVPVRGVASITTVVRATSLLLKDYALTEPVVGAQLADLRGGKPIPIRTAFAKAKRMAASRIVRRFVDQHPDQPLRACLKEALPDAPPDARSPDRASLERAWREERAWRAMARDLPSLSNENRSSFCTAYSMVAPMASLTRAAKGVGLVSYLPDPTDGRLRSVPLLVVRRGKLIPHLGCRIALDVLGIDPADLALSDHTAAPLWPVVDTHGETLINWTRPPDAASWTDVFTHVPVTRVLEVALNRETIRDNATRRGRAWAELVEHRNVDTPAAYQHYVLLVNERLALRHETVRAAHEAVDPAKRLAVLDDEIAAIEDEALVWLRRVHGLWANESPRDDAERVERDRIERLYAWLAEGALIERLDRANKRLVNRNKALLASLRPHIEDHICLVGYTASAQADFVSTPVFERMPGVMAHANVINMMLQHRFVRMAGRYVDVLMILLAGFTVTWNAARRRAVSSFLIALLVCIVLTGVAAVLFRIMGVHVAWLSMLVAVGLAWGSVTVYRQLTEERARRAFERALAQYTSPAVAARIAGRSDARILAPRPATVTCFFSDLQGFTRLSERLGPARTRDVLNPYLHGMTDVLAGRRALVNKFMGDGVFAFFNAPVLPCADHADAACDAALAALEMVERLAHDRSGACDGAPLVVRMGIATGAVFVGDYGSDTKLDYTCIGDTVNVASRLERLNKTLGTSILVDESCRRLAGSHLAFRAVGLVRVAGRKDTVSVYELRGVVERVSEPMRRFDEHFDALVRAYQAGDEKACRAAVRACRAINPDDRLLGLYADALTRLPGADSKEWSGTLRLPID